MATLQNSINANAVTPLSSTQGGSGVSAPTAHGILVAEGAGAFNPITLTNGQLLIGSTGADPVAANLLSSGSTITITNTAGGINLEVTSPSGESWVNVTGAAQTIVPAMGYTASNAGSVTFTLPAVAPYGSVFEVTTGTTSGGWSIAQLALQSIVYGNLTTTVGTGGNLTSTGKGDSVRVLCTVANTTFQVLSSQGEIDVT
jgi:hypothetical protein